MTIKNILCVDNEEDWRETFQMNFQKNFTSNVDLAKDYESALQKIKKTKYDLIILDGLEGDCFKIYQDIQNIPYGNIIIFSAGEDIIKEALNKNIDAYDKFNFTKELEKIVKKYR